VIKTKPTPSKKAKTAKTVTIATTEKTAMKKSGRHAEDESFYDRL
jgi:hypothetical protein